MHFAFSTPTDVGVCSGMQDNDYPISKMKLPLVTAVKHIPLPGELIEQFARMLLLLFFKILKYFFQLNFAVLCENSV